MEFKTLTSYLDIGGCGLIYGGLPGLVENPLGYIEAYIYERPVLRLDMGPSPAYRYFITLSKGGNQIIQVSYSNEWSTTKYLDLSELLSANYADTAVSALTATSPMYNDFTLNVLVVDENNNTVENESATLRVCHSFNGSKSGWLPSELRMIEGLTIPLSFNANGTYTFVYGGSFGSVSLPYTAKMAFTDRSIITVNNSTHSVTEKAVVRHVSECGHVQLYWLSKEAGGWKSYAFEIDKSSVNAGDIVPYMQFFTRHEGKRHIGGLNLVARSCSFADYLYLRDLFTSDYVFFYYTDTFATTPTEVIVRVAGGLSGFPTNRNADINVEVVTMEGDWL